MPLHLVTRTKSPDTRRRVVARRGIHSLTHQGLLEALYCDKYRVVDGVLYVSLPFEQYEGEHERSRAHLASFRPVGSLLPAQRSIHVSICI